MSIQQVRHYEQMFDTMLSLNLAPCRVKDCSNSYGVAAATSGRFSSLTTSYFMLSIPHAGAAGCCPKSQYCYCSSLVMISGGSLLISLLAQRKLRRRTEAITLRLFRYFQVIKLFL